MTKEETRPAGHRSGSQRTSAKKSEAIVPTGCPRGCPPRWHEWPCLIGAPIDGPVDYLDSGIFIIRGGSAALSSLREQVAA
jgi:hypothetical protein